jgi:hypothetical protein
MKIFKVQLIRISRFCLAALVLLPLVLYFSKFHGPLAESHTSWSEFGSFSGGIYSPIIAFLAALLVLRQVQIQDALNKHMFEQSYISEVRSDTEFYLLHIAAFLDKPTKAGGSVRSALLKSFEFVSEVQLVMPDREKGALAFYRDFPELISAWGGYYSVAASVRAQKGYPFEHTGQGCISKATAILSFNACVALDNVYFLTQERKIGHELEFSKAANKLRQT